MLNTTVRQGAVLAATAGVLGVLAAQGAATAATPKDNALGYTCRYGAVSVSDAAGSVVPTARKPDVALHAKLRLHNTENAALTKASYVFAIGNLMKNRGPAPHVRWRVGKGSWHSMALHWNSKTNGSLPLWNSQSLTVGTIPSRGTVTTEISVTFPKRSIKAVNYDFLDVHSGACGRTRLDWYTGNGFSYWPWHGTEGKPA
ncbi:hypothetical protein AQJ54_30190 [Streptomyces griseorubiginosus]|jgi:hypothetical protein|uniref:Uncharacterized protein n=1 Tax=Streptomyces griseorubiginosus TaxID=67304 RepID=A0A101RVS6_9ACTN|nr:hypothetical protein AQJ54_30190 [Streptomyces griseorubiginosus]TCR23933.1 hypothetical protein EV578_103254 [Streptomyces sp. BK205]